MVLVTFAFCPTATGTVPRVAHSLSPEGLKLVTTDGFVNKEIPAPLRDLIIQ